MPATYTHTATKPHTGYTRRGRNFGHTDPAGGKTHAANPHTQTRGGWRTHGYIGLCGEFVCETATTVTGDETRDHVKPVAAGVAVTCKRCRKVIDAAK